jgi:hypothetical protein
VNYALELNSTAVAQDTINVNATAFPKLAAALTRISAGEVASRAQNLTEGVPLAEELVEVDEFGYVRASIYMDNGLPIGNVCNL